MPFTLRQSTEFEEQLEALRTTPALAKRYKAVSKCIRSLAQNPRHRLALARNGKKTNGVRLPLMSNRGEK